MTDLPLSSAPAVDYGSEEPAMARYREQGMRRALVLGNRGPIRLDASGNVDPAILEAYWRCGFYVFEHLIEQAELDEIERDVIDMLERVPVAPGAALDRHGRVALGRDCRRDNVVWVKPLADPLGGTDRAHGRHQVKMFEPTPARGAPDWVVQQILGPLQFSEACLRLSGHPQLLAVAAAVNGADMTPFHEALWVKQARLGGSIAWHQDGFTHWHDPDLDAGAHGFSFMVQLYGCDAANGLWVVPGSHRAKADIRAMAAAAGCDRLPDAVPLLCGPGDVVICNRQALHCSFANTSDRVRVTVNFGFHRRRSILGVVSEEGGRAVVFDAARIRERARLIMYAIDARAQHYPNETPYRYAPLADEADRLRWTREAKARIKDYNLLDLFI
jgi:Phytanoyl-CoA dioxygenase (PhyH)